MNERASLSHPWTHSLQPIHFDGAARSSMCGAIPSGVWHHQQERGHPLRYTVVPMVGLSYLFTAKMVGLVAVMSPLNDCVLVVRVWNCHIPKRVTARSLDNDNTKAI